MTESTVLGQKTLERGCLRQSLLIQSSPPDECYVVAFSLARQRKRGVGRLHRVLGSCVVVEKLDPPALLALYQPNF